MKNKIGVFLIGVGYLSYFVFGIWGFIISLQILNYVGGFLLVTIGFIFFPVAYTVAPWYALVEFNTFFPLIISYGGGIIATVLYFIGGLLQD